MTHERDYRAVSDKLREARRIMAPDCAALDWELDLALFKLQEYCEAKISMIADPPPARTDMPDAGAPK